MADIKKLDGFTTAQPRAETALEKTIRASKEITDAETKEREDKRSRLRKARRESEADTPEKPKS